MLKNSQSDIDRKNVWSVFPDKNGQKSQTSAWNFPKIVVLFLRSNLPKVKSKHKLNYTSIQVKTKSSLKPKFTPY